VNDQVCDENNMNDRQNDSPSALMNMTAYFLERARHYRFAAAMTKNPYKIERFCEIAVMFERMAHETRQSRLSSRFTAKIRQGQQWSSIPGGAVGIIKTLVGKGSQIARRAPPKVVRAGALFLTASITLAFFARAYLWQLPW
jgi:CubicO group peptidase (beta-lactamase class C family)